MTVMENSSPILSEADWPIKQGLPGVFSGHLQTVFTSDWLEIVGNETLMCIRAVHAPTVTVKAAAFPSLTTSHSITTKFNMSESWLTDDLCEVQCKRLLISSKNVKEKKNPSWITTLMSLTSLPGGECGGGHTL